MPERLALSLAAPLGRILRTSNRQRILRHAREALGPGSTAESDPNRFLSNHCRHTGLSILEPLVFYGLTHAGMRERTRVEGEEHLRDVLAAGRGAILLLNHYGSIPAIAAALGPRGYDMTIVGNAMHATIGRRTYALPQSEQLAKRMLAYGGVERVTLGPNLVRDITRRLDRNGLVGLFFDVPVDLSHVEPFPFGHTHLLASLGPAILALRLKRPVLCVTSRRAGRNHHQITLSRPLDLPPPRPLRTAAARVTAHAWNRLAEDVRLEPEQWWQWDFALLCDASGKLRSN